MASLDPRRWWPRLFLTLALASVVAAACSSEDSSSGSTPSCPGAATVCPEECTAEYLRPILANGCLGNPEVAACHEPKSGQTLDAGCVRRISDQQEFSVTHGGWPTVDGFEDCAHPNKTGQMCTAD